MFLLLNFSCTKLLFISEINLLDIEVMHEIKSPHRNEPVTVQHWILLFIITSLNLFFVNTERLFLILSLLQIQTTITQTHTNKHNK